MNNSVVEILKIVLRCSGTVLCLHQRPSRELNLSTLQTIACASINELSTQSSDLVN